MARTRVFICYSREDDRWRAALREQLAPFAGERGPLDVWTTSAGGVKKFTPMRPLNPTR